MLECETLDGLYLMVMQSLGRVHGGDAGGMHGHISRGGGQEDKCAAGPDMAFPLWALSTEMHWTASCGD